VKKEDKKEAHLPVPSADKASAAASSSKLDLEGNPVYPAAGKPIMQVNIDAGMSASVGPCGVALRF
jgi:pre-mRNA 3'-end-processing factor FIP1